MGKLLCAGLVAIFLAAPSPAQDKDEKRPQGVFLSVEEALELAFPKAILERGSVYLSEAEGKRLDKLAGEKLGQRIVHPYRAYAAPEEGSEAKRGKLLGTAWFDTHKVRTLGETIMVVVDPKGKVTRVEILAFLEPKKYLPRAKWYAQFLGRTLGAELDLQREIRGIAGATMSCRAATSAVRRMLAAHCVADEQAAREAARKKQSKKPPKESGVGGG